MASGRRPGTILISNAYRAIRAIRSSSQPRETTLPTLFLFVFVAAAPLAAQEDPSQAQVDSMHLETMLEYPSAAECGECHPTQFRQWSVSPHAYAQLSPVFNAMSATITKLTNGTNGEFCIRCHNATGLSRDEPVFTANADRDEVSREGVTCVTCHRVNEDWGKVSGRFGLEAGDIYDTIYGPTGGEGLERAKEDPALNLATEPDQARRRAVHLTARRFFKLTQPAFCGNCHDVTSLGGFRLEEAFSEYKSSPAAERGVTCQDCHMGENPGVFTGDPETNYARGPAAEIRGNETEPRKLTDHTFAGPDHSIVHPGIFPHNPEAKEFATLDEWLQFDWEAGWGRPEFEDTVSEDYEFPERWSDYADRYDASFILDGQIPLLNEYMEKRRAVLAAGYRIGEIVTEEAGPDGIRFKVQVRNGTDGHNVPTGFIAERAVFLEVTVTDAGGDTVFVSGDLDPNGDLRDSHSVYVHDGLMEKDPYLFSLQSKFITRNIRGGEREQVLAVNQSVDPLPFSRPSTFSTVLTGSPAGVRIHRKGIEPGGHRWAEYEVSDDNLEGSRGPYTAVVRIRAGMVPVNLIDAIKEVGFDYRMSAREVADAVVDRMALLWEYRATIDPSGDPGGVTWEEQELPPATWTVDDGMEGDDGGH